VVDVYRVGPVGLHRLVDQGQRETKERATSAEMCRHNQPVSKERCRTTTVVKASFVEITAALEHVIDYWNAEHRRQFHGTVRKPIQPYKGRLNLCSLSVFSKHRFSQVL